MIDIKIEDYLPFVRSVVSRYKNMGLPYDDLLQEGLLGLWEAAERFDPDRGTKLTTYAVFWIKKRVIAALEKEHKIDPGSAELNEEITASPIYAALNDQPEKISLPSEMPEIEKQVLRLSFEKQLPLNEIAELLNTSRERIRQYKEKGLRRLRYILSD
jgi:RNA polymerase primary sigma factor